MPSGSPSRPPGGTPGGSSSPSGARKPRSPRRGRGSLPAYGGGLRGTAVVESAPRRALPVRGHPRTTSNYSRRSTQLTQPDQTQSWKLFLDGPLANDASKYVRTPFEGFWF